MDGTVRKTLARRAKAELEEKKSVFVAEAVPVSSEAEAREFIEAMRKIYHDANHHVYAYMIGDGNTARYSDDGEPQGTGGLPILSAIKSSGATDMCIVVSRYFGGTLLGTGGLSRAYGGAAHLAIDESGIAVFEPYVIYKVKLSYGDYQKMSRFAETFGAIEEASYFTDGVEVDYAVREDDSEQFRLKVTELTASRAKLEVTGKCEKAALK